MLHLFFLSSFLCYQHQILLPFLLSLSLKFLITTSVGFQKELKCCTVCYRSILPCNMNNQHFLPKLNSEKCDSVKYVMLLEKRMFLEECAKLWFHFIWFLFLNSPWLQVSTAWEQCRTPGLEQSITVQTLSKRQAPGHNEYLGLSRGVIVTLPELN